MPFYANWSFWLYVAALVPFALSLAFYGLRSPWWTSPTGRALFTLYAALTAVLSLVVVAYLGVFPTPVRDLLRITIGGVAVAGWVQLVNILQIQSRARRERCRR